MKLKLTIIISILLSVFFSACTTNSLKSGITGTLQYGEGSCVFGPNSRTYAPYSGYVYFVNSVTADSSSLSTTSLLSLSDSTMCSGGNFNLKLEIGTYYICIREYPYTSTENYFTVQPNQTTEQDFFIFKCI
jgi:hypothetical protein